MGQVLMIAAPSSGAGKTTLTLALLRALLQRGVNVRAAKSGPDYIDPQFHLAASGQVSVNLDPWAMAPDTICALAAGQGADLLLVEAAMGLLDGAPDGSGSAADLSGFLEAPVVMVIDAAKQAHSAALPLAGARAMRPELTIAGAILNNVGSPRHARIARQAVEDAGFSVFGSIPRDACLTMPSRHLGLVQARELPDLFTFIDNAASVAAEHIDIDRLLAAAMPLKTSGTMETLPPLGQHMAIARDDAFAFCYPHLLTGWREAGAEISFFSPLADEVPSRHADAIFLPGGYPELHGGTLAAASQFKASMREAAKTTVIYGECGGYMTLGSAIVDADGNAHPMLDLLPVVTSFAVRKLSLGYRRLRPLGGPFGTALMAHEFHYATIQEEGGSDRLFDAMDAEGQDLGQIGLRSGRVAGSFAHVIAQG